MRAITRGLTYYTLDAKGKPTPTKSVLKWAKWFEIGNRNLKVSKIGNGKGYVSTIFLGINTNWSGDPMLWETMVFSIPGMNFNQHRYSSKAEAMREHAKIVDQAVAAWEKRYKKKPVVTTVLFTNPNQKRAKGMPMNPRN